jgi:hypothetical protein
VIPSFGSVVGDDTFVGRPRSLPVSRHWSAYRPATPRPPLSPNSDLGCLILEFEIARLLGVHADGFRLVANCLDLIDSVGGGERTSGGVRADQRGDTASEFETDRTR